jgi:hypothetical protein
MTKTKIKNYSDFVNEAATPTLAKLKKDLKQAESSALFFKNATQQTENDKQNAKFYDDIVAELKELIRQKERPNEAKKPVNEAECTPEEDAALKALYNGIMNDGSIQRFTLNWKDVTKLIKKRCKRISADDDATFEDDLITAAMKATSDEQLKKALATFAKELKVNNDTYDDLSAASGII